MKHKTIYRLALVFLAIGIASCGFSPNKVESPVWNTEILAPLVKTQLVPDEIIQLKDIQFSQSLKMSNLGVANGSYPSLPAIPATTQGPFSVNTSQSFASVTFAAGKMKMTIQNNLPINIKSGTTVVIEQGSSVFFTHSIASNINPGDTYTMTPDYDLAGKTLSANISVKIQNLASDGSAGSVTINGSEELKINFSISGLKVQEIGVASNNSFAVSDTNNFSISGDKVKTGSVSGKLIMYADNEMPLQVSLQGYFMDENKTVIDSLFSTKATITAANVDGTGHSTGAVASKIDIPISDEKFEKLKTAKYIKSYATVATGSGAPLVFVRSTDKLALQLVSDIKITITNAQ